jgi:hypothetical protein
VGIAAHLTALRKSDALDELAEHGGPAVWRQSIATLLGVIGDLDRQLAPLERELRPLARDDRRAQLLMTIPGVAELLGLTLASEIGPAPPAPPIPPRQAPPFVWPPEAHKRSEKPGQLQPDHLRRQAPKEISASHCHDERGAPMAAQPNA